MKTFRKRAKLVYSLFLIWCAVFVAALIYTESKPEYLFINAVQEVERYPEGETAFYDSWRYVYDGHVGTLTCTAGWCLGNANEELGCKFSYGNLVCAGTMDGDTPVAFHFHLNDAGRMVDTGFTAVRVSE